MTKACMSGMLRTSLFTSFHSKHHVKFMIMVFSKDTQLNFLENFKADHKFTFLKLLPSGQLKFVVNISITLIVAGNAGNFTKYNFQKV